jgi:hypothetical protein
MAAGLSVDLDGWRREFDELMLRVGARFARIEPRRRMAAFIPGPAGRAARVNCWSIAEHAGEDGPRGCSGCCRPRSGMRPGCAMTCAAMCWSTLPTRVRSRSWTYADPGTMPRLEQRDANASALGSGIRVARPAGRQSSVSRPTLLLSGMEPFIEGYRASLAGWAIPGHDRRYARDGRRPRPLDGRRGLGPGELDRAAITELRDALRAAGMRWVPGAMPALFGRVRAPSTLGSHLRSYT